MNKTLALRLMLLSVGAYAQNTNTITGNFTGAQNKEIRLMGYNGTKDTVLCQTSSDASGAFKAHYPASYLGAATLQVKDLTNLIMVLHHQDFDIQWANLKDFESVSFTHTNENEWFQQAYLLNKIVQKRLAGLQYLLPLYQNDAAKKQWATALTTEISSENNRIATYLNQLPNSSYVKDYLQYRAILQKLQSENNTKEEEAAAENEVIALDFNSRILYYSGLITPLVEAYVKRALHSETKEAVINRLNKLSDAIKSKTSNNPKVLNDYVNFMMKQFEKMGLSEPAEHLALAVLDDHTCVLNNKNLPILEQYRKMAIGKQAPNLVLNSTTSPYKNLTDLHTTYKVLVFGASWCEECKKEIPQLQEYAEIFKTNYDAPIILVSLDTDQDQYAAFVKQLPFISSCDFKGWEGENVKNWYVFASPTIYVVDKDNKIMAKPTNAVDTASFLYKVNHP
jgi:thiol-disulfide isomerase/thioredoxin